MGLEDDARRIARGQAAEEAARAEAAAKLARSRSLIHPWKIKTDASANALLAEFARSAQKHLRATTCMVFRGAPRPSHDWRYSKGERVGETGWCLFATLEVQGVPGIEMGANWAILTATSSGKLIRTSGLVRKDTYTDTGFLGPRVVISLPTVHDNPYHGKVVAETTPIQGARVHAYQSVGGGEREYTPWPTHGPLTLRELLGYNLAAMRRGKHPQQTGEWENYTPKRV